jgi:gliding motility-associated-like protein
MSVGDTLEGRAFAIQGAITVSEFFGFLPTGCGSTSLVGPIPPDLGAAGCFALFTSMGENTNVGITNVIGDVGTDGPSDLSTGYDPLLVDGEIHPIFDLVTNQAAADILVAYNYLTTLDPGDIELIRPDLFGHNLVLTPHTYIMLGAVTFTDTLYLDARGNPDAVFVINVNGAFQSTVNSKVVLINGTQAKNVYWKIDGMLNLADNSILNGSLIVAGAINLSTGVAINGRALSTGGALNVQAVTINIPTPCSIAITVEPINQTNCVGEAVSFEVEATGIGLTYQWRKGLVDLIDGAAISGSTTSILTIDPIQLSDAGNDYNVVISSTSYPSVTSVNVSLTLNAAPIITIQPSNQPVCLGDEAVYTVSATGTNLTYQWRKGTVALVNGASVSGAQTATLTLDPTVLLDAGADYNVVVSGSCPSSATSVNVSLTLNDAPSATPSSNSPICIGNSILLTSPTVTNATYAWSGPNGFTSTDQNPILDNSEIDDSGLFVLTVSTVGCSSTPTSIQVAVQDCDTVDFFIPEGFSPNNDGINDVLVIRGIQQFLYNDFTVFNRWGNLVYKAHRYLNTWDGTSSFGITIGTDELPVGTYFYVLDLGDGSKVYKGTIYLNR